MRPVNRRRRLTPLLRALAATAVVVAMLAAGAGPATAHGDAAIRAHSSAAPPGPGPRPVPCSPAPCGQDGQPALPSGEMPESSVVHIAITPHVIQPNGCIALKLSCSGISHCD